MKLHMNCTKRELRFGGERLRVMARVLGRPCKARPFCSPLQFAPIATSAAIQHRPASPQPPELVDCKEGRQHERRARVFERPEPAGAGPGEVQSQGEHAGLPVNFLHRRRHPPSLPPPTSSSPCLRLVALLPPHARCANLWSKSCRR